MFIKNGIGNTHILINFNDFKFFKESVIKITIVN